MRNYTISFFIVNIIVYLFLSSATANQIKGCYRFSSDSIVTFSQRQEATGQITISHEPITGALIDRGDGNYGVAIEVPGRVKTNSTLLLQL